MTKPPTFPASERLGAGIPLILGAVTLYACIDASAKVAGGFVPPLQVVWFRFAVHLALAAILLNPFSSPDAWRSSAPVLQLLRALIQVVCTGLNFLALGRLQLAQNLTIQFLTPVLVTILSAVFLGERPGRRRWIAIGFGFVGVLVVARPGAGHLDWAIGVALLSVAVGANYSLLTRRLATLDSPGSMLVVMAAVPTLLLTPILPFVWVAPGGVVAWAALIAVGFFGAAAHWLAILAHRHAPASTLAPFQYFQIVASIGLGFGLFGDVPTLWTIAGAAVIIASGLALMRPAAPRGAAATEATVEASVPENRGQT